MKTFIKHTLYLGALLGATSALAAERSVTLTASVDPTVDITLAGGAALPDSLKLQYLPGAGTTGASTGGSFKAETLNVQIWSNDATKDINVKLRDAVTLSPIFGGAAIPLTVTMNGSALTPTDSVFTPATLFPGGSVSTGSIAMPLVISSGLLTAAPASGNYTGILTLVVAQAT